MLIDDYLPSFDFNEKHDILIASRPEKVYRTAGSVKFGRSLIIKCLLRMRGMPPDNFSLSEIEQSDFKKLAEKPNEELVLGLIGRPWTLTGELQKIKSPGAFLSFDTPGFMKAVWNFSVKGEGAGSRLTTETRVMCLDAASRKRFGYYWMLIRPFSGLIRMEMLRLIKQQSEIAAP
jgi:hypothetical protein